MIGSAALLAALAMAVPVARPTQTDFSQTPTVMERQSGLSFPRELAGLPLGWTQFNPDRIPYAPTLRYADADGTRLTIFLFRSDQPSAGLWFERAVAAQSILFAGVGRAAPPRRLGRADRPAGLATSIPVGGDPRTRGIAIGVQGARDWMLLAVAISPKRDAAGLDGLLARALDELALPAPTRPVPLAVPAPCARGSRPRETGKLRDVKADEVATAHEAAKRSSAADLTDRPGGWCRDHDARLPAGEAALYRPLGGPAGRWVVLTGNVGWTLASAPFAGSGDPRHAIVLTDIDGPVTEGVSNGPAAPHQALAEYLQRE